MGQSNHLSQLLVVGHADTKGGVAYNDQLSLERAKSVIAFLKDDVDTWLENYDRGVEKKKRWGKPEDRMMLIAMPDYRTKPADQDAVRWFQETRGLQADGIAGPKTRRQLITEYMALDGSPLEDDGIQLDATAHGCGEHFPLDESGEALDEAPEDEKRDPMDRRVELFFFDPEFGIKPEPSGENSAAGSAEYPKWRASVIETHELSAGEVEGPRVTFIEMMDAHFRTNSAVVLPEGETPSGDENEALTSVGVFATALRFNDEHPGKKILVAGHADTTGDEDFNQTLSEERAKCALALLMGDREAFKTLCDERHRVSDYKQILAWVSRAFSDPTFDCDPGAIDDNAATGVEPVKRFQRAYNANKSALGATGPDLDDDGDVGPLTWGAIFDCYEHALREELGEEAAEVAKLREGVTFVDDDRKALGFSEHFPKEELGVDNYKSQENRRVEVLFFDNGEEPDLAHAEEEPETCEIYLPGIYGRGPVAAMPTAKRIKYTLTLLPNPELSDLEDFDYELEGDQSSAVLLRSVSDAAFSQNGTGRLVFKIPPLGNYTLRCLFDDQRLLTVFENVPVARLNGPQSPSALVEDGVAEDVDIQDVMDLIEAYEEAGEPR